MLFRSKCPTGAVSIVFWVNQLSSFPVHFPQLPDTVGDFLNIAEQIEGLPTAEKAELLRRILTDRPEFERLGAYGRNLTDERLIAAFERAKWFGVQQLTETSRG